MAILLALLIALGIGVGVSMSTNARADETIKFKAWGQEINVRITSPANVRKWCVGALKLPTNTIACTYWVRGDKKRCFISLPYRVPPIFVFHELLNRCRDRNTKPFPPMKG